MEHILLKFISKKEYLKDFLDGKLYMNSLYYFWNQGALDEAKKKRVQDLKNNPQLDPEEYAVQITGGPGVGQIDLFEGAVNTVASNDTNLPSYIKNHMFMDMFYRSVGMGYCNVLCFHKLDYELACNGMVYEYYLGNMKEFGEYAVIIDEKAEFLRRVNRAVEKQGFMYLCGTVNYKKPKLNGKNVKEGHNIVLKCHEKADIQGGVGDAFVKIDKYAYQREWRIALYRGIKDTKAYTLEIGDTRDIVHWVRSENIEAEIEEMFQRKVVKHTDDCWYGNVDRKELRKLFYQLGDNKAEMMMVVG